MTRAPRRSRVDHDAPACERALGRAFGLLGKRWNGLIVAVLAPGPAGFADLRRRVGPISDSVLSDRLAELAEAGVVERTVTDTRPPGAQYALTPAGQALAPILEQVADWADDHLA
jgi:DNA-binding HxlR family transcriptional regulator